MTRLTKNKRDVNKIQKEKGITTDRKMMIKGGPTVNDCTTQAESKDAVESEESLVFHQGGNCFQADKQEEMKDTPFQELQVF